jgi:hypothetical protein
MPEAFQIVSEEVCSPRFANKVTKNSPFEGCATHARVVCCNSDVGKESHLKGRTLWLCRVTGIANVLAAELS